MLGLCARSERFHRAAAAAREMSDESVDGMFAAGRRQKPVEALGGAKKDGNVWRCRPRLSETRPNFSWRYRGVAV